MYHNINTSAQNERFIPSELPPNALNVASFDVEKVKIGGFTCSTAAQQAFSDMISMHGIQLWGWYDSAVQSAYDPDGGTKLPIVALRYFKDGALEETRRLMIWDGEGYGVAESHNNQQEAQYSMGLQIGVVDPRGQWYVFENKIGRRRFSLDCIYGGDREYNPVDAATGKSLS